jgi:predicted N-acyltransferase
MAENTIITRMFDGVQQLPAETWNDLLSRQGEPTPFMRHEYLAALESSASATDRTGWICRVVTLWQSEGGQEILLAACPLYVKTHSYGEYVFDWAWARAYEQHGLPYYPKGVLAVPFTPVPGPRLLVRSPQWRLPLVQAVRAFAEEAQLSSLHLLFSQAADRLACEQDGWMVRSTVQFHWKNVTPTLGTDVSSLPPEGGRFRDFDDFLASLNQEKRKKIRQERRKVGEAGVRFQVRQGRQITAEDWAFFYRCYERTYLEHGNPPYLTPGFFQSMAQHMPENWVLFIAERQGRRIASSLIAVSKPSSSVSGLKNQKNEEIPAPGAPVSIAHQATAYGRYWGALERVDCLHFEACYYQPIEWCIAHGFARFEGGAQGEHKMARALLPVVTPSAHWIAHPAFADAIGRFLDREGEGMRGYVEELQAHSPLRKTAT